MTRALIKGLPRLFVKYQTDDIRIAHVLLIPTLMNLDMYLEMRMMTVRFYPFLPNRCGSLTGLVGLRQSLGRRHKTVPFPLIPDCIETLCSGYLPLFVSNKSGEHQQHQDLGG